MKTMIALAVTSLFVSSFALGYCGDDEGFGCGSGGGCGGSVYDNICQCTDPSCYSSYDRTCLSKSSCCEAFGNVGAR